MRVTDVWHGLQSAWLVLKKKFFNFYFTSYAKIFDSQKIHANSLQELSHGSDAAMGPVYIIAFLTIITHKITVIPGTRTSRTLRDPCRRAGHPICNNANAVRVHYMRIRVFKLAFLIEILNFCSWITYVWAISWAAVVYTVKATFVHHKSGRSTSLNVASTSHVSNTYKQNRDVFFIHFCFSVSIEWS